MFSLVDEYLKYSINFYLGEEIIRVCGNKPLVALDVMSDKVICNNTEEYDYKIVFFTCETESEIYKKSIEYRDKSVRNDNFNKGYYVCDHFGKRINIVSRDNEMYVFGEDFSRVFWSYIIKYLMQIYALNNDALFVKCSAFAIDNQSTLLIGCGGSGKTTLNMRFCNSGAHFITNSNAYIKGGKIMGIGSKMRVRTGGIRNATMPKILFESGIDNVDYLVDPLVSFASSTKKWTPVKNIIVTNYIDGEKRIKRISQHLAFAYAQQFLLGMNVYRLEEDVLEYYKKDITKFSKAYMDMIGRLENLFATCQCFVADVNISDNAVIDRFMGEL